MATSHSNSRNGGMILSRNERSMPKWVSEQSDRIGPKPPPPPASAGNGDILPKQPSLPPKTKSMPEPDYEVIEFSNQQYSNAPIRPNSVSSGSKTPDNKFKCTLCGSNNPWVTCTECSQQIFCVSCDDMFHKHPKRKNHQRKTIEKSLPPIPPKTLPGQAGPTPPVAPPRRNKRGLMTPLMQRKDQGNSMPAPFPVPPSPTPSLKNASWQERFGSLPRGLNLLNRPLPETPKTPPSESSRSTTPKSVFDNIQRPPSVALEKIKSKANATLDRMQLLQQRYRQQKEQMERERSGSVTDQNISAFDQWSSISQSPSHFRSGSMSSGINSSHLDLTDENNFNLFHHRQLALQHHQVAAQRANQLGQRALSTSVFNLNQMNRKQPQTSNGWMSSPMQQAQSMAQLNCMNCGQQQQQQQQSQWNGHSHILPNHDPWSSQLASQQHLNRSNMSLNIPAGYIMQPHINGMYPPPTFMNQRGLIQQMYPQPYMGGMPIMNPGLIGIPPSTSRAVSRAGSRLASPAMSRKSVTLRRKQRSNYIDDEATDDEDSDEDDRRSIASNRSAVSRSRQRRLSSASQMLLDEDVESPHGKQHRSRARNQRRDSIAMSVHNDWAPGRKGSISNNNRSADSAFNSPLKPSRIYSDLDSEGSGTRALVQAKIEQKLKEESLKQKQTKTKRQSQSPIPQKTSSAVQTPSIKQTVKQKGNLEKVEAKEIEPQEKHNSEIEPEEDKETKVTQEDEQFSASEETGEEETESGDEEGVEEMTSKPQAPGQHQEERAEIIDDDLGPPPSTPDHEWECEFCTFVNEPNIKICSICCKTPSLKPKKAVKSISPPKQIKMTTTVSKEKSKEKENEKENEKEKERYKQVQDKSGTIKKRPATRAVNKQSSLTENAGESEKPINHLQASKQDSVHNTNGAKDDFSSNPLKNKESVEDIWATLDENIQATAHEVTRKAETNKSSEVSAACNGSSSNSKSAIAEPPESDSSKFQAREIGTSPPPQNISTQTYDTLNNVKIEAKEDTTSKLHATQPLFNDVIQPTNFSPTPKIQDLKLFEAEVLNKIHNISHVPTHHQHNNHHHRQQELHNHQANHNMYSSFNDRQRYRSNNDLRMDDAMSIDFEPHFNGLGRHQPSINELMLLQKTSSQMHSPLEGSVYDLPYRELSSLRPNDIENHKESDLYRYTTEELNAALKYCGPDIHPLVWLRDNWPKLIQTVQSLSTKYGQERAENTIGTISQMEAREALRLHTGNIWQAVSECIEQRQRKYRAISSKGNFSREDVVTALTIHQGNVELALSDLGRNQLKPFLMRIWGSPGGVENESGSQPVQSLQQTYLNNDRDIHNFLSANASDCMQTPNESGAFHNNNNQMPSPFDRPVPFNSPFDNNTHMIDNTSSYNSDSKDFVISPPPIDESILSNKNVLKDLETLIGNMEHNQQKQNENVLRSIHDIISNMNPKAEHDFDPEAMRILMKSPITPSKHKTIPKQNGLENNEADVKNFVWQHIQEIVPNLVQQVEIELMEDIAQKLQDKEPDGEKREITPDTTKLLTVPPLPPPPPIDHDEFLMEEVIKPNTKNAAIREELPPQYKYTAEIATFQMAFDKGLEKEHEDEFELYSLEEAQRFVYKLFKAPSLQQTQSNTEVIESIESQTSETEIKNSNEIPTTIPELSNELPIKTQNVSSETYANIKTAERAMTANGENLDESRLEGKDLKLSESHEVQSKDPTSNISDETSSHSTEVLPTTLNIQKSEPQLFTQALDEIQSSSVDNTKNEPLDSQISKPIRYSENKTENIGEDKQKTPKNMPEVLTQSEAASAVRSSNKEYSTDSSAQNPSSSVVLALAEDQTSQDDSIIEQSTQDKISSGEIKHSSPHHNLKLADDNLNQFVIKNKTLALQVNNINKESKIPKIKNSTSFAQKKVSKIPVRRMASNKSLISSSIMPMKTESKIEITMPQLSPTYILSDPKEGPESSLESQNLNDIIMDDESDVELYSLASDSSTTDLASRADQFQSPVSTNEVILMIQPEDSENTSTIAPSTSSSTLHSTISQSSNLKSPSDFVPSSDPSKQNLTELVEDTQRLIKQMRDEISIDDFESSTDDAEYTDEYSDEFDEGEEEELEDEDWEEEEDEEDESSQEDQDEEYDEITEDITEANKIISNESNTKSLLLHSQNSLDHRNVHNSSVLSNITVESLKEHSQTLPSSHHFIQEDTETESISIEQTMTIPNTKTSLVEPTVEHVIDTVLEKRQTPIDLIVSENHLSELPMETTETTIESREEEQANQEHVSNDNTAFAKGLNIIPSASLSIDQPLETENSLPELPIEVAIPEADKPNTENLDHENNQNDNNVDDEKDNITSESKIKFALNEQANQEHVSNDNTAFVKGLNIILSASLSIDQPLETENSLPELPVGVAIPEADKPNTENLDHENNQNDNNVDDEKDNITSESKTKFALNEQANQEHVSNYNTAFVKGLNIIPSASLSIDQPLETENSLPELPVEVAIPEANKSNTENLDHENNQNDFNVADKKDNITSESNTKFELNEDEVQAESDSNNTASQAQQAQQEEASPSLYNKTTENVVNNAETIATTNQQTKAAVTSSSQQQVKKTQKYAIQPSTSRDTKTVDTMKKSNENSKITTKKPLAASKIPKPKEISRNQNPKESTNQITKPQNEFKKKLYTRSKSFSGPTTPIGIASVKTLTQKFINPPQNTNQFNQAVKKQHTVPRKSSIVEAINKFTKPGNELDKPTASSLLFKSRTQPRIPKKKYHETCFSDDDYETTSSEEELEPLEVRRRKLSVPVFRTYPNVQQESEDVNTEALIKKFMAEELTSTIAEAQIAAALVAMKFQQDVSIWAAKECSDIDHAIALLKQECELCSGTYALNQIVSMLKCTHKCCKQCAKTYFTVQITERSINDCSCPFCKLPELHNQTEHEDENLEYFSNLDIFLKNILEPEVHELFQRKLRDRTLLKDPNFKWCVQCSSGFFARPKQKRLICPDCGSVTCAQCRKPWQKQHEGISCDQFSEWESANDPEVQAKGVQKHLEQNGIDCPKCKFRYSLSRGGCMHFTCTQCKYEFCYGCAKPFMMGAKCTISPYCAKLGLHAHHPRNCLFYLRDKLPVQLQILLKNNGVPYEIDPIELPDDNNKDNDGPSSSKKKDLVCPIPIQKETPTGLVDTRCNGDVPDKHAGMCRTHYVEYLTAKVAKAKIDPLPIFDLTDCVQELRRRGIPLPERGPWDTDEIYKNMCAEVIQKNIPLDIA